MTNKKSSFRDWFLNWNQFRNVNDPLVDRLGLVSRRRSTVTKKSSLANNVMIILFLFFTILFCYFLSTSWVNHAKDSSLPSKKSSFPALTKPLPPSPPPPHLTAIKKTLTSKPKQKHYPPLQCTTKTTNQTYSRYNYSQTQLKPDPSNTCPNYFRWIHEDLKPWKATGVSRQMVEGGRKTAHFRLVILDGKVYVERYKKSIQTRADFTLWGILQLVRWYPGKLPDLELMFDCNDRPVIPANKFMKRNSNPPVLFRYCSDDYGLDIVFPDWSFWGWAEIDMKPWRNTSRDIKEGNKKIRWNDRVPYAYWKGNPTVHPRRGDLLRCNVSNDSDWNIRVYDQDWYKQAREGYKESKLEDQCTHRYKIYIEGYAWSVSQKYILACDSMTLLVKPQYHEFFTRGMLPLVHYWPIRDNNQMCKSLKFAVEWGNNHTSKAQEIGKAGSRFIHEDLKMENVYDYMFHLLNEYAKLLRFKPKIPPHAIELYPEKMACQAEGVWRKLMEESLEKSPKDGAPCTLLPPYDPSSLESFLEMKANLSRQVELWEDNYWSGRPAKYNKNIKV